MALGYHSYLKPQTMVARVFKRLFFLVAFLNSIHECPNSGTFKKGFAKHLLFDFLFYFFCFFYDWVILLYFKKSVVIILSEMRDFG
jgi:hypothetical protein